MTAYFSVQIPEIANTYTLKTYWIAFLVVAVSSVSMLFLFGVASGTVEGKTVYKSLTRTLWDKRGRGIKRT